MKLTLNKNIDDLARQLKITGMDVEGIRHKCKDKARIKTRKRQKLARRRNRK